MYQTKNVKRRTKQTNTTRRTCIISCTIKGQGSSSFDVCKQAFISIHEIGKGRSEYIVEKIKKEQIVPETDKRGKHENHKKKHNNEDLNTVRNFIEKLLKYESHYSGTKNFKKLYMSLEYTVESLFEEYKKTCDEHGKRPVSSDTFRGIFTEFLLL